VSRPREKVRGRDARPAGETPAPLPDQLQSLLSLRGFGLAHELARLVEEFPFAKVFEDKSL